MLRVVIFTCVVQVAVSIIVTDPPPTPAEYKYSYEIVDPTTGDTKSLHEIKHGNVVSGSYSVVDPDGTRRTVDYTAGARTGFKAVVRNEPLSDPHSYDAPLHVPYSSLYHSHNFKVRPAPYVAKKIAIPVQYIKPVENNQVSYFSPGAETPMNVYFKHNEFFKPNNNR